VRGSPLRTLTSQSTTSSLIKQLTSSAGEGFTEAQAEYAADQVGLSQAKAVTPPPPPPTTPAVTNGSAVVLQFYQDITNGDYSDAWALGGDNIGGGDYAGWVAGYDTTASVTVTAVSDYNATTVYATISATQDDGSVRTYAGTYTVSNGVITSADISQTS